MRNDDICMLGSHILSYDELKPGLAKVLSTVSDVDLAKVCNRNLNPNFPALNPNVVQMYEYNVVAHVQMAHHEVIRNVAAYVRSLDSAADDVDAVASALFKDCDGSAEKVARFKDSMQYFVNGTQDGFMQLRFARTVAPATRKQTGSYSSPAKEGVKVASTSPPPPAASAEVKDMEPVKEEVLDMLCSHCT